MHRKEQRPEPRARDRQPRENAPEKQHREDVQEDVYDVIAGGVIAPEPPLKPEGRDGERGIIGRGGAGPDIAEAVGALYQRVLGYEQVIVPHEARAHGRDVAERRREDEARAQEEGRAERRGHEGKLAWRDAVTNCDRKRRVKKRFSEKVSCPSKSDLGPWRVRRREQKWTNLLVETAQRGVMGEHGIFDLGQAFRHGMIGGEGFAQADERGDEGHAHLNSFWTVEHIGGHERPVLGEGKGRRATAPVKT